MTIKKLPDGTPYIKVNHHNGKDLKGEWELYIKVDGVRALRSADGCVVSRNGKPLYNLNHLDFVDAEIYYKDWSTSVSLVRSQTYKEVTQDMVYKLPTNGVDKRLKLGVMDNPTNRVLVERMRWQVRLGNEGIVLRQGDKWIKLVPEIRVDLQITGYKEGKGKNAGMLGSFTTSLNGVANSKVGTGMSDEQRINFWERRNAMVGTVIEVSYRELTSSGKLKFPAFQRERFDKNEEG